MNKYLTTITLLLSIVLFSSSAFSSGACCSLSKGKSGRPSIVLIGSSAWSHERIDERTYTLKQFAGILKGALPLTDDFILQAQLGLPINTKLEYNSSTTRGNLGIIYGLGIGYVLPEIFEDVEFFTSFGYSRSLGNLKRDENGKDVDQSFRISEVQGILLAETSPVEDISLYGGIRLYYGKNQLDNSRTGVTLSGKREGNVSPLFGLRYSLLEDIDVTAEGGFGHTTVFSLATILSF